MRIALVHYTYPPTIGGVEIVMGQQARILADAGHRITVICESGASNLSHVRVVEVGKKGCLSEELRGMLASQDIVFVHNVCTMPFNLALTEAIWQCADELRHVRWVCWVHDLAAINPDYHLPFASAPWSLLTRAHPQMEYIAVSELRARQLSDLTGLPPERCRVIPNGIDPAATLGLSAMVATFSEHHQLIERELVLLQPARLLRRKNVELGLHVTAALREAGRNCAYIVTAPLDAQNDAASVEYLLELQDLRASFGLEADVLFVGDHLRVNSRDVASLYALADALFFPSWSEGFGLPLLEAALHRLPIFCADIEPMRSLLDQGATCFPLDASPEQIAALVMRQSGDCEAMQRRKAVVRRHAWPAIYRNFLAPLLAETKTLPRPQ